MTALEVNDIVNHNRDFLIDPYLITNHERNQTELETFFCFCPAVAGKKATMIAGKIHKFFTESGLQGTPMEILSQMLTEQTLGGHLRRVRMGKYALLTRCYRASLASGFNLRTVTTEELETIPGFGQKSSRFFILHSRPGANVAVIDTHMLKYLRAIEAPNVPKTIPSGKDYTRLEELLLQKAKSLGLKMAEFDLNIWKWYADNKTGIPEFPAI